MFTEANLYAYEFGMIAVGVAGLILCYDVLPDTVGSPAPGRLGPHRLRGPAGGSVLQVLGFNLNSIQAIPGGLWELFIGVWLIAKGFNTPSHLPLRADHLIDDTRVAPPLVASATP